MVHLQTIKFKIKMLIKFQASGAVPDRQESSHPHGAHHFKVKNRLFPKFEITEKVNFKGFNYYYSLFRGCFIEKIIFKCCNYQKGHFQRLQLSKRLFPKAAIIGKVISRIYNYQKDHFTEVKFAFWY